MMLNLLLPLYFYLMLMGRGTFLYKTASTAIITCTQLSILDVKQQQQQVRRSRELSLVEAINIISKNCDRDFLKTILKTNKFLYRGEDVAAGIQILKPAYDLFLPETYGSTDAVDYFQCLEDRQQLLASRKYRGIDKATQIKPSIGHIATSVLSEASQWGGAVSVWPLANPLRYVWLENRRLFYPTGRDGGGDSICIADVPCVNKGLDSALVKGHEVMFSGDFMAIPSQLDDQLAKKLHDACSLRV